MKELKKIIDNNSFFVDFSLFWVIFGWLALALTLLDFFYAWIFIAYFIIGGVYFSWTLLKGKFVLKLSRNFIIINIALLLVVTLFSFFVTPTVFTGRDQGSISNASILLSENHKLRYSTPASEEFFAIYGAGKALNFPGFHYTPQGELLPQFPLGYISWLGAFHSMLGFHGLVLANAITLFAFFLSFYVIGRKLLKRRYALIMLAFALTSFSFVWFFKFTLSENLAMALLWTMIVSIYYLTKSPGKKTLLLFFLSSTLLAFTRIEGYAFFITGISLLIFNKQSRTFAWQNRKLIAAFAFAFILAFALNLWQNFPFFREIGKASIGALLETGNDAEVAIKSLLSPSLRVAQIYILYGLVGFFLAGFFGIASALLKKKYEFLLPLLIIFPALIYFVDSNISSDHPWMLRRFVFAILPLFIFYSAYFVKVLSEKNPENSRHPNLCKYFAIILCLFLVLLNLKSFSRYAFFSENENLLKQTEVLSQNFSDGDLILADRLSSGSGWSLLSGPMRIFFNKQAVYFFNISDLKKINLDKFDNVYILTSRENLPFYAASEIGARLTIVNTYALETKRLINPEQSKFSPFLKYPQKEQIQIEGYILKLEK